MKFMQLHTYRVLHYIRIVIIIYVVSVKMHSLVFMEPACAHKSAAGLADAPAKTHSFHSAGTDLLAPPTEHVTRQ